MNPGTEKSALHFPKTRHGLVLLAVLVSVAVASLPGLATAAEAGWPEAGVTLALDPGVLWFEPGVEAPGWMLTVSGPAGYFERQVFSDEAPRLDLVGAGGALLADGTHSWELRVALVTDSGIDWDVVEWGHFIVHHGVPMLPKEAVERSHGPVLVPLDEAPVPLLPTHGTDVYIDGHLCVGGGPLQDLCTGTEPLALRTILMKDDNVRLRFEDVSNPAGTFPSTDWQLTSNDSTNNGDDYFAVQDLGDTGASTTSPLRIDAGAGDNAIRVDGSGEVGIGTATPGARLHVMGDAIIEGDFAAGSSRNIKHEFAPVENRAILAKLVGLGVNEWSYRSGRPDIRHLGPVAEEFHAAFSLGRDERHISPLDLSGVAFAAIQGLHEVVREREAEIEELRISRDELASRIAALECRAGVAESACTPNQAEHSGRPAGL